MNTVLKLGAIAAMLATTAACTPPQANSTHYYPNQALQASSVQYGTIVSGRVVELRNAPGETDAFAGAALGGAAGALIGDQFGGGRGNTLMTGLGAIAGATLGAEASKRANRSQAVEWVVELEGGRKISVVQSDPGLSTGMPVSVITNGATTRIVPR